MIVVADSNQSYMLCTVRRISECARNGSGNVIIDGDNFGSSGAVVLVILEKILVFIFLHSILLSFLSISACELRILELMM